MPPHPARPDRFDRYRYVLGWEGGAVFAGFFEATGHDLAAGRGVRKAADVLLQRGVADDAALRDWLDAVRGKGPDAQRGVVLSLLDSSANPLKGWLLQGAWPHRVEPPLPGLASPTPTPTRTGASASVQSRLVEVSVDALSLTVQKAVPV